MTYDLVVIGGGPAGIVGATEAAGLGRRVALVDNHPELGGAGTNTGTVPSKTLRETALALSGMRTRKLYGVDLSLRREATVSDFLRHERNVKEGMNYRLAQLMQREEVAVRKGTAEFLDPKRVRIHETGDVLEGEHFLIATGSSPVRPPDIPFGEGEIYDSDTILELDRLPGTLAVIGAGTIGSEYACTFAALGTEVHIVDGRETLLSFLDGEISRALLRGMESNGIAFHWKEQACSFGLQGGRVRVGLTSGAVQTVDAVLVAAGRKSNVESLNLKAAGVEASTKGLIPVDENYRTNVPHIAAAGDVIGYPALASTGMDQARRAVRRMLAPELFRAAAAKLLPSGVYTIPEVGTIGETEETLQRAGVPYLVGRAHYGTSARGRIIGDEHGFLKLLFRRDDMKLAGVHAIGEQATELVHIGMMAMLADCGFEVFDEACFNIPTLGALYKTAALDAAAAVRLV
ncbi:MAG: Si-specific NAD(P)(+) transhydrogenase [Acidobacteriota bacterium]|nr:Si-specific NAD(P)(+) transhydrogenase [Acidobacteriota bacterium]